jgi:FlaA1/EpsC-like NDP-sugar epimerase
MKNKIKLFLKRLQVWSKNNVLPLLISHVVWVIVSVVVLNALDVNTMTMEKYFFILVINFLVISPPIFFASRLAIRLVLYDKPESDLLKAFLAIFIISVLSAFIKSIFYGSFTKDELLSALAIVMIPLTVITAFTLFVVAFISLTLKPAPTVKSE